MNQNFNYEVGQKLRSARKSKKMSLEKLGEMVNLHASTVSRYEKGEINSLDIDKLKEFASVLGVSPAYLMGWDDEPNRRVRKNMSLEEVAQEFHIDFERVEIILSIAGRWENAVGKYDFSDDEFQQLVDYAQYLKSRRRETK